MKKKFKHIGLLLLLHTFNQRQPAAVLVTIFKSPADTNALLHFVVVFVALPWWSYISISVRFSTPWISSAHWHQIEKPPTTLLPLMPHKCPVFSFFYYFLTVLSCCCCRVLYFFFFFDCSLYFFFLVFSEISFCSSSSFNIWLRIHIYVAGKHSSSANGNSWNELVRTAASWESTLTLTLTLWCAITPT